MFAVLTMLAKLVVREGEFGEFGGPRRRVRDDSLVEVSESSVPYDDTGISTRNKSPSLSVTYNGYKECTFDLRASRRFPLWSVHPPDENLARMPSSSSCLTKINGLESSGTCQTLCSTSVEPPRRLTSTVPIPMIAQCCEFQTRTESECRSEYCRNCDR